MTFAVLLLWYLIRTFKFENRHSSELDPFDHLETIHRSRPILNWNQLKSTRTYDRLKSTSACDRLKSTSANQNQLKSTSANHIRRLISATELVPIRTNWNQLVPIIADAWSVKSNSLVPKNDECLRSEYYFNFGDDRCIQCLFIL